MSYRRAAVYSKKDWVVEKSDESSWVSHSVRIGAVFGVVAALCGYLLTTPEGYIVLYPCTCSCGLLLQILGPAISLRAYIEREQATGLKVSDGVLYGLFWGATSGVVYALMAFMLPLADSIKEEITLTQMVMVIGTNILIGAAIFGVVGGISGLTYQIIFTESSAEE